MINFLKIIRHLFFIFVIVVGLFVFLPALYAQQSLTITTYYPPPAATYARLKLSVKLVAPACTGSDEWGTVYYDGPMNSLQICVDNGSGAGQWTVIAGAGAAIWDRNSATGDVFLKNINDFVSLGSNAAEFKLTLVNDGGILAKGAFGSGKTLTTNGPGTRLIWYPRKAAFRAGAVTGTAWDDGNIGDYSTAFGLDNLVSGNISLAAGANNRVTGNMSLVGGGEGNQVAGNYAAIGGGQGNDVDSLHSIIFGGKNNRINLGEQAVILGGFGNLVTSDLAVIGGGINNRVGLLVANKLRARASVIVGGENNVTDVQGATIVGGKGNTATGSASSLRYPTVVGGLANTTSGLYATVRGGASNIANGQSATIGGGGAPGMSNFAVGAGSGVTIAGGISNLANDSYSTVGGGTNGVARSFATVGGGANNFAGFFAAVPGGLSNNALNNFSSASGQSNRAFGICSTVLNGLNASANGNYSVALGQGTQTTSLFSWVGGKNMLLANTAARSFVWGNSAAAFNITQPDSFLIFPNYAVNVGKVGVNTVTPTVALDVNGAARFRGIPGGGGGNALNIDAVTGDLYQVVSSRRYKKDIKNLVADPQKVLNLQPVKFTYKSTGQEDVGLIAEDVDSLIPDLVIRDGEGRPESVKYDRVVVYLLEVAKDLKKHNDTLKAKNALLKERLDVLEKTKVSR